MSSIILQSLLLTSAFALPQLRRSSNGPVISSNFQDPCVLQVGKTWYAYSGPNGNPDVNVQIATSSDFSSWSVQGGVDVLPDPGSWAASPPHVWAPDVNQLQSGQYILYYAAATAESPSHHCIGAATSTSPTGPFEPMDQPLFCDLSVGGAIDPNAAIDPSTGKMYVVYKVDGNSIGNGGSCNNGNAPIVSTPIILQEVSPIDGVSANGDGYEILTNEAEDGPMVEAPALVYNSGTSEWVLFYNSGCFTNYNYKINYATASNIGGPYTRQGTLLSTDSTSASVQLPGGIDVTPDGKRAVFHGDVNLVWVNGDSDGSKRDRAMYAIQLDLGQSVSVGSLY